MSHTPITVTLASAVSAEQVQTEIDAGVAAIQDADPSEGLNQLRSTFAIIREPNQTTMTLGNQTSRTTEAAVALAEAVRADAHMQTIAPRARRLPAEPRADLPMWQVLADPNKFASDESIAEQVTQTVREVVSTANATTAEAIEASTTSLQQARRDLSARSLGAISGLISGASPAGARSALGGRHLGRHRRRDH